MRSDTTFEKSTTVGYFMNDVIHDIDQICASIHRFFVEKRVRH